ncbi:MAG TPA: hypothetical protein VLJ15_03815 [Gammaproteobacteria bacterium]|nr:hypothetical protein [Gammaproteobacteria bacterium]
MSRVARYSLGLGLLLCIFVFTLFAQANLLINWDVSWDLLVTKRLLAGGSYTKDFFDLNPPLIFYEYMPVILLERLFPISEAIALQLYVFFLSFISIIFCSLLLKNIFSKKEVWLRNSFLFSILLVFLVFPANDFGQREHVLFIFTLPYFLTVVLRREGKPLPVFLAVTIGLFAALGFGIKPFFVAPFILAELYYMISTRQLFSWLRVETAVIIFFLALSIIAVFVFYPDYIDTVIPVAKRFYYDGFSDTWRRVLSNSGALFCYFSLIIYLFQFKKTEYGPFKSVMTVALLGFLAVYLLQKTNWTYHIYPAYSMALLMSVFFLCLFIKQGRNTGWVSFYFIVIFLFATCRAGYLYHNGMDYKESNTPLVAFLKNNAANRSVYFIGASPGEIFPAINNANVQYASRFLHLFWMPGIIKNHLVQGDTNPSRDNKRVLNLLTDMLAEDIRTKKPEFILVDIKDLKPFYEWIHFDYLSYLSNNPDFKDAFKPYHYFTTLENKKAPLDQKKVDLYYFPNEQAVPFDTIQHRAIVITGTGNIKRIYFASHKKQITIQKQLFYRNMVLTPEECNLIKNRFGLITRNQQNADLLNQVITHVLLYPYYKFAVYQRERTG